ncbi:MAG: NADH-quinone oxidoreductase subunit, partial [Acidobacteriota bacterium]|nr:NADH-quinone oxidoreductase subunit [Acidobacteriota bacterium]
MPVTRLSPGVVKVERQVLTLSERVYLPQVFAGMFRTLKHLLKNLVNIKGLPTIQYPEVKREYSERFRGRHILTSREDGTTRCVACYMCST